LTLISIEDDSDDPCFRFLRLDFPQIRIDAKREPVSDRGDAMNTKTVRSQMMISLATLVLMTVAGPRAALGAGMVTTCDEAHLDAALSGGGLVTFNCGVGPMTIDVSTFKTINVTTTIDGGGRITIRNLTDDVFHVTGSARFTVRNLMISSSLNGIVNAGTGDATATNCTFSNNHVAGIFNSGSGTAAARSCTFYGNEYGMRNGSTGAVTATSCTFSSNEQGIDSSIGSGPVTATNCTFSGNTYGIIGGSGTANATNCTFSGNTVGIHHFSGAVTATNCILANIAFNCEESVIDGGHNLEDADSCGFKGSGCSMTTGSSLCKTDPNLDPAGLQNNGGLTQTIAVLSNSPAINAGNQAVCAAQPVDNLDQRGFVRPDDGNANCTIGAFEFASHLPGVGAPALSVVGLLALVALLTGVAWRKARTAPPAC
jgi:Right handed beta helix region